MTVFYAPHSASFQFFRSCCSTSSPNFTCPNRCLARRLGCGGPVQRVGVRTGVCAGVSARGTGCGGFLFFTCQAGLVQTGEWRRRGEAPYEAGIHSSKHPSLKYFSNSLNARLSTTS